MTNSFGLNNRLRALVAIVGYGEKNLPFLRRIIDNYRALPVSTDIVVLSEAAKDLGPGVTVKVGLPTRDPWSLAFGHKNLFAENVDGYDLFIYSEDDIEVTASHLNAFISVTSMLPVDAIAGFLRYESDNNGRRYFPDIHGPFRWKPESVHRHGSFTVAEHTNEHAAFYILTREQLRRAIASGGFLLEPYEGRHDMLCSAATDPYTRCGFRKVICISELSQFLVHHMSNRYAGKMGVPESIVTEQIQTLMEIGNGVRPATTLCNVESKMRRHVWSKDCYEKPRQELLGLIPRTTKSVLSVGAGWGEVEEYLRDTGCTVTALAIDSVHGANVERKGIEVVLGGLSEALLGLNGRIFDCVLVSDLLHLLPDAQAVLAALVKLVSPGGSLVIGSPNFYSVPVATKRFCRIEGVDKLRSFSEGGINAYSVLGVRRTLRHLGLKTVAVNWYDRTETLKSIRLPRLIEPLFTRKWALLAHA